ncbi:MAG: AAA family ATPase, partial [Planctomycetota bacterium]|nr:AAA family ATPase [Planctomycetota bacterium]
MKIRSLAIRRMPGFETAGFDLSDLSEGLNLIIGPNASGKTTVCHAIRGLLWPEELAGLSPVSLASDWADGANAWRLELEGSRATCQRNGVPADRPPLPAPNLARC